MMRVCPCKACSHKSVLPKQTMPLPQRHSSRSLVTSTVTDNDEVHFGKVAVSDREREERLHQSMPLIGVMSE